MTDGIANRLCGIQRSLNLPETFEFGDVLDSVCRTLLEDLVFLSSCNVVHRDSESSLVAQADCSLFHRFISPYIIFYSVMHKFELSTFFATVNTTDCGLRTLGMQLTSIRPVLGWTMIAWL